MTAATGFALLVAMAVGVVVGWLLHAARTGDRTARAEAQLAAMADNERLLRQALGAASEDSARRHSGAIGDQVEALVGPLRAAVGALTEQVEDVERTRMQAYAGLREQVAGMHRTSQQLTDQTGQLVTALRAPQIRGRWGELQLERVVELAGMTRHCDFDTQVVGDGVRPDLVVRLAGGKQIVVDAKVPFTGYLDAAQARTTAERDEHLARHARQLRAHIDQLAAKAYWAAFEPSPEFVVLFLPGDPFLDAALTTEPGLLDYAFGKNVILTTPTTLIALLRTVAHTWRQEAITREAATIQQLGRELYARLGTAGRHLDRLGSQLGKAVDSYNHTVASMESRVMVTARRLNEMELFEGDVEPIKQIDSWPRAVGFADPRGSDGHANDVFRS
ncbi:DNA recombination protein RmuC [Aldersonia sp. NBC_00410]|uniref:DNA recombination protein RmuC n=1 Tax=Aldersonia sp. NBC_00410 TaxID=2975954 RepID=UPI00224FD5FB|nr:DNA recombination protein RmuC [Aldersonia sp. NBC_00410]MCX5043854.1 DNA recombination protein RmuC [Aldersonia sp. NBC_00410]